MSINKKNRFVKEFFLWSNINKIIPFFTALSSIGFWTFLFITMNIQWSHIPITSYFIDDYEILLENPQNNRLYSVNDTFTVTFILDNKRTEMIDVEFDIKKDECITTKHFCKNINEECPKSPNLKRDYFFKDLERPQYITVKGVFMNCSDVVKLHLIVNEPGYPQNSDDKTVEFNPSKLNK